MLFLLNLPLLLSHHPRRCLSCGSISHLQRNCDRAPLFGARAVPVAEVALVTVLHSLHACQGALNRISLVLIVGDWVTFLSSAVCHLETEERQCWGATTGVEQE